MLVAAVAFSAGSHQAVSMETGWIGQGSSWQEEPKVLLCGLGKRGCPSHMQCSGPHHLQSEAESVSTCMRIPELCWWSKAVTLNSCGAGGVLSWNQKVGEVMLLQHTLWAGQQPCGSSDLIRIWCITEFRAGERPTSSIQQWKVSGTTSWKAPQPKTNRS